MRILIYFFLLFLPAFLNAQSLSYSKLNDYLSNQSYQYIEADLTSKGFKYVKTTDEPNYYQKGYSKTSIDGKENISIVRNDEMFSLVYQPTTEAFNSLMQIILTPDFEYSYSYKNIKYYENGYRRVGINSEKGILSLFVNLK